MVSQATIDQALRMLQRAAPGARIILFGSHARGQARPDSDLDFIVVQPEPKSADDEMVRLRNVLRPLRVSADILVTSKTEFEEWSKRPGTVWYRAAREGKVFRDQP